MNAALVDWQYDTKWLVAVHHLGQLLVDSALGSAWVLPEHSKDMSVHDKELEVYRLLGRNCKHSAEEVDEAVVEPLIWL